MHVKKVQSMHAETSHSNPHHLTPLEYLLFITLDLHFSECPWNPHMIFSSIFTVTSGLIQELLLTFQSLFLLYCRNNFHYPDTNKRHAMPIIAQGTTTPSMTEKNIIDSVLHYIAHAVLSLFKMSSFMFLFLANIKGHKSANCSEVLFFTFSLSFLLPSEQN